MNASTFPAADFHDSMGVNVKMTYFDSPYGGPDDTRKADALKELGIKHARAGIAYFEGQWAWDEAAVRNAKMLQDAGCSLLMGIGNPGDTSGQGGGTIADHLKQIRDNLDPAKVAGIENPNEYGGDPELLRQFMRLARWDVGFDPVLNKVPVVAPSFTSMDEVNAVGNQEPLVDYGNIHPYGGADPPYRDQYEGEIRRNSIVSGHRPFMATEHGYAHDVPDDVAAIYLERSILEMFITRLTVPEQPVVRNYIYQLVDLEVEGGFGLCRADWTRKPMFSVVKNLLAASNVPPLRVTPLDYKVTGPDDLKHFALQTSSKTYTLFLWRTPSVWDKAAQKPIDVPGAGVILQVPGNVSFGAQGCLGEWKPQATYGFGVGGSPMHISVQL